MWAVKLFQLCYTSILKVPHNYGDIISHRFSGAFWITGFDEIFFLRIKKGVEFRQQLLQRIEHPLSPGTFGGKQIKHFHASGFVDCLKGGVHLPSSVMNSSLCEGKYVSYPFLLQNSWNCFHVNRVYSLLRMEYPCSFRVTAPLSMRSLISLFGNIPTALHVEISPITMTILLEQAEKVSPYFKGWNVEYYVQ